MTDTLRIEYGGQAATAHVTNSSHGFLYVSMDKDPGFGPVSFPAPLTADVHIVSGDRAALEAAADKLAASARWINNADTRAWHIAEATRVRSLIAAAS